MGQLKMSASVVLVTRPLEVSEYPRNVSAIAPRDVSSSALKRMRAVRDLKGGDPDMLREEMFAFN